MVEKSDMLIFKLREKRQQVQQMQPQPRKQPAQPVPQRRNAAKPIPPTKEENVFVVPPTPESTVEEKTPSRRSRGKYEAKSREAASGLFCEWHPWRSAYAICYKCTKPYCYEDISEYNGRYYCLEDIDSASSAASAEGAFEYNKLGLLAATVFIVGILIYVFFLNNLLIYVSQNVLQVGLHNFIELNFVYQFNYAYLMLIGGFILMIVEFIAGIMILAGSRKAYTFGIFIGFLSTAAFSYIYLQNSQLYSILISVLSFTGIITLASSKRAVTPLESIENIPSVQPSIRYSNVSSF